MNTQLLQPTIPRQKDFFGPLVLIFIGVIFLLQNFDYLPSSIWSILWQFWPILLVLGGLQLYLSRHKRRNIIVGFATLATFTSLLVFSLIQVRVLTNPLEQFFQTSTPITITSRSISSLDFSEADFDSVLYSYQIKSGRVEITDTDSSQLVTNKYKVSESSQSTQSASLSDLVLEVATKLESQSLFNSNQDSLSSKISSQNKSTSFAINQGAGTLSLDLDETSLADADLDLGTGTVLFDLTNMATASGTVKIDIGVGSAQIALSENSTYDISYDVGVGRVSLNGDNLSSGFGNTGNAKQLDTSQNAKLKIEVSVGTGNIEVTTKKSS